MTHTYAISGMTCNGCRTAVEGKLSGVSGVINASVSLETEEAVITMHKHIPIETFQNILPSKYNLSAKDDTHIIAADIVEKTEFMQLYPLFLILGYISVTAFLLNQNPFKYDGFMLDFMGLFFIVFSFFKMLDVKGFSDSFRMYDPLAQKLPVYGLLYPFLETALGLMFLFRYRVDAALFSTLFLLGITTIGVTKVLLDKKSIQCACLGTALKLPMTKATFIENCIMIVMSLLMVAEIF